MSKRSEWRSWKFYFSSGMVCMICLSVTSNSSISFKDVREPKFWHRDSLILMQKKLSRGFLKFCLWAEILEFFF